jgi:hypothetical protein
MQMLIHFSIGYSSGAVAAMRYVENHTIYGSILIGACYTDFGREAMNRGTGRELSKISIRLRNSLQLMIHALQ